MAKKRNCRRTPEEVSIHDEAVKLRKMTDVQLVEKVRSASVAASETPTAFEEQALRPRVLLNSSRHSQMPIFRAWGR